jgi:hypothetical protein
MRKDRKLETDCWYDVDAKVLFFIKLDDGLRLLEIMQRIKQTFAVRFSRDHGRTGPWHPRPHAKR